MLDKLKDLEKEVLKMIGGVESVTGLETIRIKYLGRKGELTAFLRSLHKMAEPKRRTIGRKANELKKKIEKTIDDNKTLLQKGLIEGKVKEEWIDVTQSGTKRLLGHLYPVTQAIEEIRCIFESMGYEVVDGPEVEDDYHSFGALNILPEHPARDAWDTFYLTNGLLMRPHTSPVQIRTMKKRKPPLRFIVPGRVYRYEAEDATHLSVLHQLEGFAVDSNISFADLKGTLLSLMRSLFGKKTKLRFRPSFFPFTEPSAEVDVTCVVCGGKGCRSCGGDGWVELLGAGMIHHQVLRNVGYNPEKVSGFAFGIGLDRIAMIKYRIEDIRDLMKNDLRFLRQF